MNLKCYVLVSKLALRWVNSCRYDLEETKRLTVYLLDKGLERIHAVGLCTG